MNIETVVEIDGTRYLRSTYKDGFGVDQSILKVERKTKNGNVWALIPEWKCRSMRSVIESAIRRQNKG